MALRLKTTVPSNLSLTLLRQHRMQILRKRYVALICFELKRFLDRISVWRSQRRRDKHVGGVLKPLNPGQLSMKISRVLLVLLLFTFLKPCPPGNTGDFARN